MSDFKTRLIAERSELGEKCNKLKIFLEGEKFHEVEVIQKQLLRIQYHAMITYWECLNARLANLP